MKELADRYAVVKAVAYPGAKQITAKVAVLKERKRTGAVKPTGFVLRIRGVCEEKDIIDEIAEKICNKLNTGELSPSGIPKESMNVKSAMNFLMSVSAFDKRKFLESIT